MAPESNPPNTDGSESTPVTRLPVRPNPSQTALNVRDQLRALLALLGITHAAIRAERVYGEDFLTIGRLDPTAARKLASGLQTSNAIRSSTLLPGMVMWCVSRRELVQVIHTGEMHASLQSVVKEERWTGKISDLRPPNMQQITTSLRARAAGAYRGGPAG